MFQEPDNDDRADFAEQAVNLYAETTRHDPREQTLDADDNDDAREYNEVLLGDLVGDLLHLCDRYGVDFARVLDAAHSHYDVEIVEDGPRASLGGES